MSLLELLLSDEDDSQSPVQSDDSQSPVHHDDDVQAEILRSMDAGLGYDLENEEDLMTAHPWLFEDVLTPIGEDENVDWFA